MTALDRRYTFIAKTFDAPAVGPDGFIAALREMALPLWRQLHRDGVLVSVQALQKVGDVDLQTSAARVRDWEFFILLELSEHASPDSIVTAELDAGFDAAALKRRGIEYLSNEVMQRPAGAGTAIPLPAPGSDEWPASQLAAIEYIDIPLAQWDAYRRFMKEVMGPVGAQLVREGHSYQVKILERVAIVHRDESLPDWNRVHLLWGEFDDPVNGFFKHTNAAISTVLGAANDVRAVLEPVNSYRVKPRMSKNRDLPALSIARVRQR